MKKVIGIFILSLYSIVFSQTEYLTTVKKYTTENGLAGRFANYTLKDSRGIIWMGTQHGLHRFDGRDFKVFDEESGLPFPEVMEIYEDAEGYLWLYRSCYSKNEDYCTKDLVFFHTVTHEVVSVTERFGEKIPFKLHEIERIVSSEKGDNVYIQTLQGTFCWASNTGFTLLPIQDFDPPIEIFKVLQSGKLGCIQRDKDAFVYSLLDSTGKRLHSQTLSEANREVDGFSIFPSKGVRRFNLRGVIIYATLEEVVIFSINEAGEVSENKTLADMTLAVNVPARHSFYDEAFHSFWSADREGIIRHEIQPRKFKDALANNASNMLWEVSPIQNDNLLLIQLANGSDLYILDKNKREHVTNIGSIKDANIKAGNIQFADENDLQEIASIHCIFQEDLFIITQDQSYKYLNFSRLYDSVQVGKIQCVKLLGDKILLGTLNGFLVFDLEKKAFLPTLHTNSFADFENSSIHVIEPIGQDSCWIGTNKGIFLVSLTRGVLDQFSPEHTDNKFLPTSTIYHFSRLQDSSFWLATRNGLVHWAGIRSRPLRSGKRFMLYTTKEGLPDKHCVSVFEDENQFIWVATIRGLVQLEPHTGNMRIYNHKDGLKQEYFLEYAHHQDSDGTLFFGGLNGLTYFDPNDFREVDYAAPDVPLIIVDFEQYNQQTEKFEPKTKELLADKKIVLEPNARIFTLRMALADYRSAEKHQFSYRIPGYQEDWQTDASNVIRISGIPYGKHHLEIRGRLPNGHFSSQMVDIPIHALRPFYLNGWFYALLFVFIAMMTYSWYKVRIKRLENRQKELETAVSDRTAQIESDKQIIEKQAEELRNLDKLKSRFFANVSHELRTPLTLILAPLKTVIRRESLQGQDDANIRMAYKNGKRLLNLVNELLDLSKLESGNMKIKLDSQELFPFISRIIASFESFAKEAGVHLTYTFLLDEHVKVKLDPKKTEIILINLLSNAFKFTSSGGTVAVNVALSQPETQHPKLETPNLLISVSDTGRGIHPKDLPYIFNRFFQSEQIATAEGGTGIGLALSQEFSRLMGGKIHVSSELDKGSIFALHIPFIESKELIESLEKESITPPEEKLIIPQYSTDGKKAHLLLVEDNVDLRRFIKSLLDPIYHVTAVQHGQEGLRTLAQMTSCDLIISDIMMPVMDGYQMLEIIKADPDYLHIPVIMLTARADIKDKLKALRIGVDDYILKPFEEEELLVRAANLIRNKKARQKEDQQAFMQGQGESVAASTEGQKWLQDVEETVRKKLNLHEFNVENLAFDMSMSRQNLNAKIKGLTGLTASQYIQEARLMEARDMLASRRVHAVKAAALEVGIKDVKYFSKKFKERFGKLPSAYL